MRGHAVFDLDGTLVDSVPLCAELLNAMLADRGADFRISHQDARPHVTRGGPAMVAALLGAYCGEVQQAISEFRQRYAATPTPASSLYPNVRESLATLRDLKFGLAVWSNKPQQLCEKVLSDLELADYFAAIVGTGPGTPLKPDPAGLDRAFAEAGASRARSCYIGDSELDHEVARCAGVPFVMLTYGYGDYSRVRPGAFVADSFAAVPAIVASVLGSSAQVRGLA